MNLTLQLTCTAANEAALGDDGFALLAPYGDAPNVFTLTQPAPFRAAFPDAEYFEEGGLTKVRGIQRITAENSAPVAAAFGSLTARVKRWFRGAPIYRGHPDMPGAEGDATELGLVARFEARADGQYGQPVFNAAGAGELDGDDKLYFSPRYDFVATGVEAGRLIFEPRAFISTGLTPFPNLAAAAANASSSLPSPMTVPKILTALALAGAPATSDAEDAILAAISSLGLRARNAATAANECTALQAQLADAQAELATRRTTAANEAVAAREAQLTAAIRDGRITAAERPAWEELFAANAGNAAAILGRLPRTLKTADRPGASATAQGAHATAANESPEGFVAAYAAERTRNPRDAGAALAAAITANPIGYRLWLEARPQPALVV
jgi:hypothetical protein